MAIWDKKNDCNILGIRINNTCVCYFCAESQDKPRKRVVIRKVSKGDTRGTRVFYILDTYSHIEREYAELLNNSQRAKKCR